MRLRAVVSFLLLGALLGCAVLWRWTRGAQNAATTPAVNVQQQVPTDSIQTGRASEVPLVAAVESDQTQPSQPRPEPGPPQVMNSMTSGGMIRKFPSDDLNMYMTLTSVSDFPASSGSEFTSTERAILKGMLRTSDLDDEELRKILEYSRAASALDRAHQAREQERICSERASLTTLDEIGTAMNDYKRRAETYQEELGQNAESGLGAALFSKISTSLRYQQKFEISDYDAIVQLHSQNRKVDEVVELFCSYGK